MPCSSHASLSKRAPTPHNPRHTPTRAVRAGATGQGRGGHGHIVTPCPHALAPSLPGPRLTHSRSQDPAHPLTDQQPPPRPPHYTPARALPAHYSGPPCLIPGASPLPAPLPAPKPPAAPSPTPAPCQPHYSPAVAPRPTAARPDPARLPRVSPGNRRAHMPGQVPPWPRPLSLHWLRGRSNLHARGAVPTTAAA